MMTIRFSNLVSQAGKYHTGAPNYCDVDNTYAAVENMITFAAKAMDDSWADGDTMGIRIYKSAENYKVWYGYWDAANEYVKVTTEEESVGTLLDADDVTVSVVVTGKVMNHAIWEPQFTVVTGTTYTILSTDMGKTVCFTNGSAVAVTLDEDLPVNFQCLLAQEGVGVVTADVEGADTINGIGTGTGFATTGQYQGLHIYQRTAGAWIALGA